MADGQALYSPKMGRTKVSRRQLQQLSLKVLDQAAMIKDLETRIVKLEKAMTAKKPKEKTNAKETKRDKPDK